MRLLVGHDGRNGGRDALELARVLAGAADTASVVVVTVLEGGPEVEGGSLPPDITDKVTDENVKSSLQEAREALADFDPEVRAYWGGSPAGVMDTLAERERFDTIVVGSSHRGKIGRMVIGSVGRNLLNGAPADVAVAPAGYAESGPGRLGTVAVGYSGSPESKLALERAKDLASASKAKLRLITVVSVSTAVPMPIPGADRDVIERPPRVDTIMSEGLELAGPLVEAETERRDGEPAFQLLKSCREGVDLLVLGSRGYGPLARALLGSVSHKVTADATFPVLVTRRPR